MKPFPRSCSSVGLSCVSCFTRVQPQLLSSVKGRPTSWACESLQAPDLLPQPPEHAIDLGRKVLQLPKLCAGGCFLGLHLGKAHFKLTNGLGLVFLDLIPLFIVSA